MTIDLYKGLNAEQTEAVRHREGPCLVVAGAGSGKTTVMTRRAAALIAEGVEPSRILLLTFTRAAAQGMTDRATRLVPEAADITSGTFHSIAHRLIKENARELGFPESPSVIDPSDVNQIFKRVCADLGGKEDNMPPYKSVAKIVSFSINTRRDVADVILDRYEEFAHAIGFVERAAKAYSAYKRERSLLDYDDLLVGFDRMLAHPVVGKALRLKFDYVLVDEHQDDNAVQCSIIEGLGAERANIMVVGDPAQSIYAFRGSAPRTMFAFRDHFANVRVIYLNRNYRSTSEILDVGNSVDRAMRERFERELTAVPGNDGDTPTFVTCPDDYAEARYIAERILFEKADGTSLEEQAVLVRSMRAARFVEGELIKRRIPYKVSGGIKISEAAHIKDLLSLARITVNRMDEPAWLRILTVAKGVGEKKALQIFDKIAKTPDAMDPTPAVMAACKDNPDIGTIMATRAMLAAGGPPSSILDRALCRMDDIMKRRYPEDWKGRKNDCEAIVGMAEKHEGLEDFLAAITLDHSVDKSVEQGSVDFEESPITISTVHSAKGLEWDVVYVPNFVEGHFPSVFAQKDEDYEEELRILYVAMTRPRRTLVVTRPTLGRMGAMVQASRFQSIIEHAFEHKRDGLDRRPVDYGLGLSGRDSIDFWA